MSDLLTLTVPSRPAVDKGRRASVLAERPVLVPSLPDLGQSVLPDPGARRTAPVLPGDAGGDAGYLAGHAQGLAEGRAAAAAEHEAERAALIHARVAAEQL
ncbi:MAG: hypothetical protein JWN67_3231, partial [Actinomycetia bacterium]|nr:hypothetical protein [Actinomycetes bacterium]